MNEYYVLDAKFTCCGCLKISEDLLTMSASEITWFKDNVEVDTMDNTVKICYICRHMLHKSRLFISQCQQSSKIMKCVIQGHADSISKYKPTICNYVATGSVTHYFGPNLEFEVPCYNENDYKDDKDDINNDINNDVADNIHYEYCDEIKNDDEIKQDDDDVPLVMFKDTIKEEDELKVKKKKKKKHKAKKCKRKKQLKEGFSSRMVQETNEYEVIKLTKEQVIQEMQERMKSEKYLMYMYRCDKCAKGFNFKDVLENHMRKHSQANGALKCDICEQHCPSTVSLRGHMKSHTTRYKCKVCEAVRNSRQHLLEHYAIEHTLDASKYTCEQCPFTTNKRTVIQRHVRGHKLGKNLTCSACGVGFNNMHSLRMHSSRHNPVKKYSCDQCHLKFKFPCLLQRHMRSHLDKDRYCVECDVTFKTIDNLKIHFKRAKRHRDPSTYNCDQCHLNFKFPCLLQRHMDKDRCRVECDVTFKTIDNLKIHFKRAKRHRDPSTYKFKCSQCDERFITPSSLLSHLTARHGACAHACAACGRLYASREGLRAHVRQAHGGRVSCDVCSREFTRKHALVKHLRTHDTENTASSENVTRLKKQENVDGMQTTELES